MHSRHNIARLAVFRDELEEAMKAIDPMHHQGTRGRHRSKARRAWKIFASLLVCTLWSASVRGAPREVDALHDDLELRESTNITAAEYHVPDRNDNGAIRIKGNDLVIDGRGCTLVGSSPRGMPDEFSGRGIVIEDSARVTLRNFSIRGFKIAILAINCREIVIENCDVSKNYRQHLLSTPEAENGADWLFGHENDTREWFRYGAGIYLEDCMDFTLRGNTGHNGQNGICLVRSHHGWVHENDMSFNSGWGLALYRASDNVIDHNKLDWCIRGYSHGVYNRGQDSAGILVYEQCCKNVFAYNSATHGGDGFFLFAGLETLDETGTGGCNDNLVYANDFSHASNNGIEATFSKGNVFCMNALDQADHAIWAGYSYENKFIANRIRRCNHGISIEHGSDNEISHNTFEDNKLGINLWSNETSSFKDKPYGKTHHCLSQNYLIDHNHFSANQQDVRIVRTDNVRISNNDLRGAPVSLELIGPATGLHIIGNNLEGLVSANRELQFTSNGNYLKQPAAGWDSVPEPLALEKVKDVDLAYRPINTKGKKYPYLAAETPRGLEYILVDEWGPYDFSSIRVTPANPVFWGEGTLRVLGPKTPFRISQATGGVKISPEEGTLPATLQIRGDAELTGEFSLVVELPDRQDRLTVRGSILHAAWQVSFFAWESAGEKMPPANWEDVLKTDPLATCQTDRLDFAWGNDAPSAAVRRDFFATVATAKIRLPAGKYELRTVSDDGIRVTLDGNRIIDRWNWHPPREDRVEIDVDAGEHEFRVEHFEIDGVAQLQLFLRPLP